MPPKRSTLLALLGTASVGTFIALTYRVPASAGMHLQQQDTILGTRELHDDLSEAFNKHISTLQRSYLTKEEYKARKDIFKKNYEYVQNHNNQNSDYKLEMNRYADWSDDEREKFLQKDYEVADMLGVLK